MNTALLSLMLNSGGVNFSPSPESQAVFAYFTGANELTMAEKVAMNRFINSQSAFSNNWSKLYGFIPLCGLSTSAKALINWKGGVTGLLVASPTYGLSTGFTTNGTSNYINTQINPSTANGGGAVALNSTFYGMHVISNAALASMGVIGTTATGQALINVSTAGVNNFKCHTSSTSTTTNTRFTGKANQIYIIDRLASNLSRYRMNSQTIISPTQASIGVPVGRTLYVGAFNNNGTAGGFGAASYGAIFLGERSNFDHPWFQYNYEILMQELGVVSKTNIYPVDMTPTYTLGEDEVLLLNSEGQSNSLFAATITSAAPSIPAINIPIPNVYSLWRPDVNPMQIQQLDYPDNHTYGALTSYNGSGLTAVNIMQQQLDKNIYVWHYGIGGSSLTDEGNVGDRWDPDLEELFFDSHQRILATALPLISNPIKKIIFHWGQGESDAVLSRTQAEYTADFYHMLSEKISFMEAEGIDFFNIEYHIVVARLAIDLETSVMPTRDQIIAAQNAFSIANFVAAYPSHAGKINSITVYSNDGMYRTDEYHMGADGYILEGYRMGGFLSKL